LSRLDVVGTVGFCDLGASCSAAGDESVVNLELDCDTQSNGGIGVPPTTVTTAPVVSLLPIKISYLFLVPNPVNQLFRLY
jgi:hypothetical protein